MALLPSEIARAFPDRIPPVAVGPGYRLALAAVLGALILLQALYAALVLLAAAATAGYAAMLPAIISAVRINALTLPLILAPLAAGAIMTFFLFKPLFARRAEPPKPLELSEAGEPGLFEFLSKLCDCLGSPRPARIFVNLDVNASASLARGWRSLFTNELALTIGLPLVQGLSLRQFTGVLAHEFGHFSQSAGLRVHFLIGSIQIWFLRVAHDRDDWDIRLETWHDGAGWRGKIVTGLAKGVVWLSRRFLSLLQKAGNLVSAAFSRQMEFDADRYETLIAGVEAFEATTLEMPVLTVTASQAWSHLDRGWTARRFANDIPALMAALHQSADGELVGRVKQMTLEEETNRFATHPSPADRIANARTLGGSGLFTLDGPATRLFEDFGALSRAASEHHYQNVLGFNLPDLTLLPAEAARAEAIEQKRRESARYSLFGPAQSVMQWLRWPDAPASAAEPAALDDSEYWQLADEVVLQGGGIALLDAGAKIKPEVFRVSQSDATVARQDQERSIARLAEAARQLRLQAASPLERLRRAEESSEAAPEFNAFRAILAEQDAIFEVRLALSACNLIEANAEHIPGGAATATQLYESRAHEMRQEILGRLGPLADSLRAPSESSEAHATHWFLDRAEWLGEDLLQRVCQHTVESERARALREEG